MIYILSDDNYFALGIIGFFQNAGKKSSRISVYDIDNTEFYKDDIIILSINNYILTENILKQLSRVKIRVIMFLEIRKNFDLTMIGGWGICTKRASPQRILQSITMKNKNDIKSLSPCQSIILKYFSLGCPAEAISRDMNISVKTVSAHKLKGLRSLGLGDITPLFGLVFINIFKRNKMYSVYI